MAAGVRALLVLDGAGWHGSRGPTVPANITHLPLPPYVPESNPADDVWRFLPANKLAMTVFDTYAEIVEECCKARSLFSDGPDPVA